MWKGAKKLSTFFVARNYEIEPKISVTQITNLESFQIKAFRIFAL